jgi:hypothetical protein
MVSSDSGVAPMPANAIGLKSNGRASAYQMCWRSIVSLSLIRFSQTIDWRSQDLHGEANVKLYH